MRILMITDDELIDRRILQEAETLVGAGHDVVLLARSGGSDLLAHERIGHVKVERIAPRHDGGRERLVAILADPVLRPLARIGEGAGAVASAARVAHRAVRVAASQTVRIVRRTRRLPYRDAVLVDRGTYYRPDVVHAHDLPQLRAAVEIGRRLGVPVVYDAHELYTEIASLRPRLRARLRRIERRLIPRCAAVITVNPYLAAELARRYRIEPPTVVLNAVDPASVPPADPVRDAIGATPATPVVLYQGWLAAERGLVALVDAFAHVPDDAHLVLLGYGDGGAAAADRASALGLGGRVHVLPAVPQSALPAWTASADVGVIPYPEIDLNHRWCSPNKLYEFVQAGVPIVANDLPYLRDVVVGEGIGEVAPIASAERFGAAVTRVLDPAVRPAFAQRARDVAPRYTWSSQEPALLAVYAGLPVRAARGRA